ncbi:DUF4139 domain-containing protein [Streptomyces sp. NPDC088194]|uniref:DUF4139 domain-containing protein n=1 Tax=Streptomyces sp. NPDC088194 TaxID=3154931 RepID=UPI0034507087
MENGESAPPSTADSGSGPGEARSVLTAVVVHAEGAMCTRRASVVLPTAVTAAGPASTAAPESAPGGDGTVRVRIGGLPPTLSAGSLRGSVVSGPPGLRVADIRVDVAATLRRGEEAPGLRLDLEDAEDRLARLRDRRERLAGEIEEVAGFRAEPPQTRRGDPPRWAPVESILALAGFVDARLAVLHTRLRATEDELEQAEHDADILRHRLNESSGALLADRVEPSVYAVVTLVSDGAGPADGTVFVDGSDSSDGADLSDDGTGFSDGTDPSDDAADSSAAAEVELEYHVPGATWAPVYQLRLDGDSGAGTLVLRACVAQRTGEDWTGVRLGLSTADLLRRADLPELRSLRIGRSQQEPAGPGWREPPPGLDELFTGYDTAKAAEDARHPQLPAAGHALASAPVVPPAPGGALTRSPSFGPLGEGHGAAQEEADFGYGGAAEVTRSFSGSAPPAPAPPSAQPRHRAAARRPKVSADMGPAPGAPPLPTAPLPALAPQPAPPAHLAPAAELLDYASLVMAGPQAPEGRGTLRTAGEGTDAVVTEYRRRAAAVARLARPAHAVDVRLSAGSFDYRFDTAAPADVEADGQWHTVPVSEIPVRTEFEYVCVPAQDTAVFGTVLVTNTSAHPLLAGPADVMVDGDFVRTAALPTLAPGQRQAVGLGVAESVQVARRAHMRESTAGLRGGTTVLDHTVEVEVANRLPYPALVEVRERIPTSADKDVRIEERRADPRWTDPGAPLDGQEGTYVAGARVWRVTLEPGRTATLTGGFEIRLPVGKSVVGGNRRN